MARLMTAISAGVKPFLKRGGRRLRASHDDKHICVVQFSGNGSPDTLWSSSDCSRGFPPDFIGAWRFEMFMNDKMDVHCVLLVTCTSSIIRGREECEMPTVIDKTPIHDDAIGWSRGAIRYARGEVDPPHHHPQGQLLFATKGHAGGNGQQRWVIPAACAVDPPFQEHTYSVLSATELRAVWFSPLLIAASLLHGTRFT
jgi:hypothetical protein